MTHEAHSHGHHAAGNPQKNLLIAALLTGSFCVVELIGGVFSRSLALASDAGHMFIDFTALAFVLFSAYLSQRPPSTKNTYGYYRLEILSAFINGGLLVFIALEIFRSAFFRWSSPPEIKTDLMLAVAVAGLCVNIACMLLLRSFHGHLGTRSAYLHVMSDLISSVAAIVAALAISYFNWLWLDPLTSVLIGSIILLNARNLLSESMDILLEAVPQSTPLEQVQKGLRSIDGVQGVHDLHVWTIGSGFLSATAHLSVFPMDIRESEKIVKEAAELLKDKFKITHSTFQIESIPPPRGVDHTHAQNNNLN